MNRFERAVYDCMKPTAQLLERTTKPLHRAILLNFWRHVHLEDSGEYDKIVGPDMMVDHPVYRVTWGANPAVIEGKDGVRAFYKSVGEAVLWHSDDRLAVADWGICDEITFHQLAIGSDLKAIGYQVERADRLYHVYSAKHSFGPTMSVPALKASISTKTKPVFGSKRSIALKRSRQPVSGRSTASS